MTDSADFDDVLAADPVPADPEDRATAGWRADPAWRLLEYDASYFTEQPADVPPQEAELAQPDAWASLYVSSNRIVATWCRIPL